MPHSWKALACQNRQSQRGARHRGRQHHTPHARNDVANAHRRVVGRNLLRCRAKVNAEGTICSPRNETVTPPLSAARLGCSLPAT